MDHQTLFDHIKLGGGAILVFLFGITLDKWVGIITLIYLIMQIGLLIPRWAAMIRIWWYRWHPK